MTTMQLASTGLILIAEDNFAMRECLKETLKMEGYEVITAANGLEALDILDQLDEMPDLILTDILMKPVDGMELQQTVRQKAIWRDIPFIFISGNIRVMDRIKETSCLMKPFKTVDLLAAVMSASTDSAAKSIT